MSTVLLTGTVRPYEIAAFGSGWPRTGDELARVRVATLTEARDQHAAFVARFTPDERPDPTDPNWVFRLLGLPPRRYPRARP